MAAGTENAELALARGITFARAFLSADFDTSGAMLDRITGDNHATAELLCGLTEIAKYAAGDDLEPVLDRLRDQLLERP